MYCWLGGSIITKKMMGTEKWWNYETSQFFCQKTGGMVFIPTGASWHLLCVFLGGCVHCNLWLSFAIRELLVLSWSACGWKCCRRLATPRDQPSLDCTPKLSNLSIPVLPGYNRVSMATDSSEESFNEIWDAMPMAAGCSASSATPDLESEWCHRFVGSPILSRNTGGFMQFETHPWHVLQVTFFGIWITAQHNARSARASAQFSGAHLLYPRWGTAFDILDMDIELPHVKSPPFR